MNNRLIYFSLLVSLFFALGAGVSCSPVTSSRIGPAVPEKHPDCDMAVLAPGKTPDRPYRDVGMVFLKNCPEYDQGGCRKWLVAEACRLGGDVIYAPNGNTQAGKPESNSTQFMPGDVTWTLTVAAYVSELAPSDDDPVLNSTPAKPCDLKEVPEEDVSDPEDQMCTE